MAKIRLKRRANPKAVARRLRKQHIIMKQLLPDGCFMIYRQPPKRKEKS